MLRVIRMRLQYEGTRYHGFAAQPGLSTVQEEVERALADVLGHAVRVVPAGRTDAGVHAVGQVLSFQTEARLPAPAISRALNARLPVDIIAGPGADAPAHFDARRFAKYRHYRYAIWNQEQPSLWWRRYSLHFPARLDLEAMRRASGELLGRHDFTSFIGHAAQEDQPRSPVRTVLRADWTRRDGLLQLDCCADAFGRHMVRTIVGTLLAVGRGRLDPADFEAVLAARDRRAAGPTAAAHGLTLMSVDYGDGEVPAPWQGHAVPTSDQESQT